MSVISRRYATALFQAAEERGELDPVRDAIGALDGALKDEQARDFILDREVAGERKQTALEQALQGAPELFMNFLRLVFDRGREMILPEVGQEFERLDLKRRGEARAHLELARDATPEELEALRTKAEAIFGLKVDLDVVQNPDLIGGFRMTVNNERIDASVRTRIERLRDNMTSASIG